MLKGLNILTGVVLIVICLISYVKYDVMYVLGWIIGIFAVIIGF